MSRSFDLGSDAQTTTAAHRRQRLRVATHEAHMRLEDTVAARGYFETPAKYGEWLRRSHAFHRAIEHQVRAPAPGTDCGTRSADNDVNSGCRILIEQDLADLDLVPYAVDVADMGLPKLAPGGSSGLLAIRYVVEGSNLGARVLYKRALALNFGPHRGARHLADRAARTSDWRDFVAELESLRCSEIEDERMCQVAKRTFDLAQAIFGRTI